MRDPKRAVSVRAPGRVNLIGDHTDYQDGFCLPLAIDREVVVHASVDDGTGVVTHSPGFATDVADSIVAALRERGYDVAPADVDVQSTVPAGSGLSSSAAFSVAVALALSTLADRPLAGNELALTAQRAEHIAGVPCGVMDQMASVHGRAGHALLLDCRSLDVRPVPLPPDLAIVVVHSGLPRALAGSAYAERRAACEAAARRLGLATLRDASLAQVADDPFARHVVSENARVLRFVDALERRDTGELGALLDASHESLARDFQVSTPELDVLCEALRAEGAIGARLTGAGFGGCVVALAPTADAPSIAAQAADRYRAATHREPNAFVVAASDGASILEH